MLLRTIPLIIALAAAAAPAAPKIERRTVQPQCDTAGNLAAALVAGQRIDGLDTAAGRNRLRAAIGKDGARIAGSLGQPYGCTRALVSALQKLGYGKIDFAAERPPEEPDPKEGE